MTQKSEQLVRRASIAASVGLALMLTATLGYIGWPRVTAALGTRSAPAPRPPAYVAGETVDVPSAWYSTADTTLVLFASASCGACQKAQPFLTKLVGIMNDRGAAFMAHRAGFEVEDAQFAQALGVKADHIVAVKDKLKVHATPTLLIINREGRILHAWEGVGTEDSQAKILAAIDGLGTRD